MRPYWMAVLAGMVLALGCAARRPPEIPPSPPEALPAEGEALAPAEAPALPAAPDAEAKAPSWDDIKKLGTTYEVQAGDSLSAIAAKHKIGTGLLVRLNDLKKPNLIRKGQKLTVIEGPLSVKVSKAAKILSLYKGDTLLASYPVALGRNDSTPEGEFAVLRKLVNPPWTDPYHRTILKADNPEYPLGTRWIEFKAPPGAYGIHGTKSSADIGQDVSFGCVRVLHPQEEEIFDFVTIGSPVAIAQ
ncbi:MAG: L,D-transpeptidase family protein [Candidatus Aureabacteria bacterium]|nr:L,D-transpeptidase family protein [Candidatus Auribacterota bacterium]